MAKLFFRYGAMNSGKSTQLLQVRHNYHERHQKVLLLKPEIDDRDGVGVLAPRPGNMRVGADHVVTPDSNLISVVMDYSSPYQEPRQFVVDCVLVDECQFLGAHHIHQLSEIADRLGIPVMCYGLRADFRGKLFPATEVLMAIADNIEEIKTICWCGKKATMNARVVNGQVVYEGPQVLVGGNESYTSLCRKHWLLGQLHP